MSGDLAFDGITYETALASVDVFVAAVALLCEVDESAVSVVISQARRRHLRRRLDDAGSVVVTYTVAVETEAAAASVNTLIEDSSTEDVSTAVKRAATEAGADEDFADVETTAVGTPTTALAPQPDDDALATNDAPATTASEGSSGGGGGPDAAMGAGIGAVGAVVLLALFGGGVVWRRRRAKAALRRGGEAAALRGSEETGYDPKTREALLERQAFMTYNEPHAWLFSDGKVVRGVHEAGRSCRGPRRTPCPVFREGDVVTVLIDFARDEASWFVNLHSVSSATHAHTMLGLPGGRLFAAIVLDEGGDLIVFEPFVPANERRMAMALLNLARRHAPHCTIPDSAAALGVRPIEWAAAVAGEFLEAEGAVAVVVRRDGLDQAVEHLLGGVQLRPRERRVHGHEPLHDSGAGGRAQRRPPFVQCSEARGEP